MTCGVEIEEKKISTETFKAVYVEKLVQNDTLNITFKNISVANLC